MPPRTAGRLARATVALVLLVTGLGRPLGAGAAPVPDAATILAAADRFRGLSEPYGFRATVRDGGALALPGAPPGRAGVGATVVAVRSNGRGGQLIVVLEPRRGDLLLKLGDVMWLRPRRLHRLTRMPAHLRMFQGAAVSDVATIDLARDYRPTLRAPRCGAAGDYVLDLVTTLPAARYPRAVLRVACDGLAPRRVEFQASSGKVLKAITYVAFEDVLGRRIATRLIVEDHVLKDVSVVEMSAFERIDPRTVAFTPEQLLALPAMAED